MSATITVETIRPEVAAAYLLSNTVNRKIRPDRVHAYAAAMTAGKWAMTGDPIVFDADGKLIQGQHRLSACVMAEQPFTTAVMRGAGADAYAVMDSGMARQASDVIGHMGLPSSALIAAAAKVVLGYRAQAFSDPRNLAIVASRQGIAAEVGARPDDYIAAARTAHTTFIKTRVNGSAIAAFVIIASDISTGSEVEGFIQRLCDGVGLDAGAPELALRSWAINAYRMNNIDHLSAIARAWNASVAGQPLRLIRRWQRGTAFPRFTPTLTEVAK